MKLRNLMLKSICAPVLVSVSFTNADDNNVAGVTSAWIVPGAEWFVRVKQYSMGWALGISDPQKKKDAQIPKVQFEFDMRITVLEPQGETDNRIARIQFTPLDNAPDSMRGKICVLELDAGTGKAKAIKEGPDENGGRVASVVTVGIQGVLETPVHGFPIEWIISATDVATIPLAEEDRSLINEAGNSFIKKLRPTTIGDDRRAGVEVEAATTWPDTEPYRRVTQSWVPGEAWWRSFRRYIRGNIVLEATLVDRQDE